MPLVVQMVVLTVVHWVDWKAGWTADQKVVESADLKVVQKVAQKVV